MYILKIQTNGVATKEQIDRLVRIYQTPQDPVVKVYVDTELPDGFVISKFDGIVKNYAKAEPMYAEQADVKKAISEQTMQLNKAQFVNNIDVKEEPIETPITVVK